MSVDANASAHANLDQKVLQYENFINEVLRNDLQKVLQQRDSVFEKISQYLQLKNSIESLQDSPSLLKTDVDLGCSFFVQAEVEDSSRIFVAVGYGFFVEMNHDEALRFIDKKTSQLTTFTEQLSKDSAEIKANIRMVIEGLRELQGLSDLPESERREVF
ncbi:protein UXT [Clinocottus analis]|uniref:protein UXT n=1 Tax=Clinocottus analis TaxID=304258 RepID=UPI0035C20862